MTVILVALGIFACICCSAFFSASEMAISSCNHVRLENAAEDGSRRAKIALLLARRFDDSLSAILIGNNLANIAGSSLASIMVILLTGNDGYAWLATVIMTLLEDKLPITGDKEFEVLLQSIVEVTMRMLRNMGNNGRDLALPSRTSTTRST